MKIICPGCQSEQSARRVNVEKDKLICNRCSKKIVPSSLIEEGPTVEGFDISRPPRGISYQSDGTRQCIRATLMSGCGTVFSLFFTLCFIIFTLGFFLFCLTGELNFFWVFAVSPLLLLGLAGLLLMTAYSARGGIVVTIEGDLGTVFTGVGKIGRTKSFYWSEVQDVREEVRESDDNAITEITLLGSKRVRFGSGLKPAERYYMLQALRTLHAESHLNPQSSEASAKGVPTVRTEDGEVVIACPSCDERISPDRINLDSKVGVCDSCDELFALSKLVGFDPTSQDIDLDNPPSGVLFRDTGMEQRLSMKLGNLSGLIFLTVFDSLWCSGVVFIVKGAIDQRGGFDITIGLFGLFFVTSTLLLLTFSLFLIFGKTIIRIEGDDGRIFTGVGPIGKTRRFRCSEIHEIREDRKGNGSYRRAVISLIGQTRIQFGGELNDERRRFVLAASKKLITTNGRRRRSA
jgi:hypothetical protein